MNINRQIFLFFRYVFFAGFLSGAFALGVFFSLCAVHWIDFSPLEQYHSGKPSIMLDDQGNEWARFQLDKREPIAIDQMPKHLIQAFLAAEDWHFFEHHGISFKGIVRSSLVNLYHRKIVQGASTITQQLVKLLFFDLKRTFSRKIKEQVCSVLIEEQFTKEQIIEAYLNHVCFGCGIYGVQAASKRFWNKDAIDLTVAQAATLAGIVRNPQQYCPLLCPYSAERRRNVVLKKMQHLNFISEPEGRTAQEEGMAVDAAGMRALAPHLKETLRIFLEQQIGKNELYTGGYVIQTTLNQEMQQQAERAFEQQIEQLKTELPMPVDGGIIAMDTKSGGIKALVGGASFKDSKFNRALQARRQIGSVLKPLIYAAGLQQGMQFTDTVVDEPIEVALEHSTWRPRNYNRKFSGQVTLAHALSRSSNIIPVKLLLEVGAHNVIVLAKKCHMKGPFYPYPSLALGCVDASLSEAVGMFNIFANGGVYVEPHMVAWIKDQWGTKVYKAVAKKEMVLDSYTNDRVAKVLELSLKRVRKWYGNNWIDAQAISKTGTTNDSRTCWYVGSTPTLTTAVYVGPDDNRSMGKNIYPIRTAFPIWLAFNKAVTMPVKQFSYDPRLQEITIDEFYGTLAMGQEEQAITIFA